ncbi:MAG: hypothetical protein ACLFTK_04015 [Anaerolineales bacterium]
MDEDTLIQFTQELHGWKARWEPAIARWAAVHRHEDETFALMIECLPLMLQLMVNMLKDPRFNTSDDVPKLIDAVKYVFNEVDRIPEAELGVPGLTDDAARAVRLVFELGPRHQAAIINNWPGSDDVNELLERLHNYLDGLGGRL